MAVISCRATDHDSRLSRPIAICSGLAAFPSSSADGPRPSRRPDISRLKESLDTEVVTICAGLAGGLLVLHLAQGGLSSVVLESRQPGWGASRRKAFFAAFREHRGLPIALARENAIDCEATQRGYLNAMTGTRAQALR
ncbi:FAD-dependent oxidoreductase [Croceicoccus sp. F390]|uniref:FAD-dependent oxidoreductase n=1 Tax=Croceicoccus esteveae TaxID=3075597 RepID=A0ABU2ZKJ1_9SPHN|nr:FAD-dependent oxidoreductase [Croceicoccus sp. F390]MDT0577123.1 FAD-dependent oxidoreductase [Croceicoccus sp. F390]